MTYAGPFPAAGTARQSISALPIGGSNVDDAGLARVFTQCGMIYLGIYVLEAVVRYGLYLVGKDSLILLRDGLMAGPLLLLCAAQGIMVRRMNPVLALGGMLLAFHALILVGNVGSVMGAVYGAKIMLNMFFGFFAASLLLSPDRRVANLMGLFWVLIMIGIVLDKFVMTFPWTGIRTVVGDLNVDVSKDWFISDPMARRVAGFTRSSIAVAAVLPCLSIILMARLESRLLRAIIGALALAGVFLTTQKGALIAFLPVVGAMCLPVTYRLSSLRACFLGLLLLAVGLPLLTIDLHLPHGDGVFSMESLYLRIAYTWPQAWDWIERSQLLIFGVGLGGIGGPQRLFAPNYFNPADNIAVLFYAYFGIFAFLYVGFIVWLALRRVTGEVARVEPALAVLAFTFGYGAVLSVIEDQSACLFMGAAIGVLWRETARHGAHAGHPTAGPRSMPYPGGETA
jgi:hypothetical protein